MIEGNPELAKKKIYLNFVCILLTKYIKIVTKFEVM